MILKAGKSEIRMSAWLGSGGNSLPGLQMAVFMLYPQHGRDGGGRMGRESNISGLLL